jgi:arsenite methyltransferase
MSPSDTLRPVENAVLDRYSEGAKAVQPTLCCPVDYDTSYLKVIPQEVIDKDYGCGDPSKHVREGETVLDLGSGGGKICFIASQKVGPKGRVIGVDMNDDMLALAQKHRPAVAAAIGYDNVQFIKARIQAMGAAVADGSVDVVVSNCVLNLVSEPEKPILFKEIFRVLRKGGRAVISDIVADEDVPVHLKNDADLWSGCISGALAETGFLQAFEDAGFHGIRILKRDEQAWQTVEGIEFRSLTVEAFKGKQGPCLERNQAVVYVGPFKSVTDDDGHTLHRGERMAVCDKTYKIYTDHQGPYAGHFVGIEPREAVPLESAGGFNCKSEARRSARETKGLEYRATTDAGACCGPDGC